MRTPQEIEDFEASAKVRVLFNCKKCSGLSSKCACRERYRKLLGLYEGCVPRSFWKVKDTDIVENVDVFEQVVKKYVDKMNKTLSNGYGLVFTGNNGVGKTLLTCYILKKAIEAGRTVYYTTLPQLDYLIKMGFKDNSVNKRLEYMLTSDIVAIDELGKERHSNSTNYMVTQFERIMKKRSDDSKSVLLASNLEIEQIYEIYGPTVGSIITGKSMHAPLFCNDYRENFQDKMVEEIYK